MSMAAVVNYAPERGSVELRDLPDPEPGPDDVLLEVAAIGVCGSDLHQWTGDHSWPVNYPVVLGHEFAGIVRELGERVTGWQTGDRVVSETAAVVDADSPLTRQGLYNLDPKRQGFGYGVDGAMTSLVRVPVRCLHRVPDGLPLERAALTEPCCVAFNAVGMQSDILPGDRVAVLGPGPIGLLCAAVARLRGAAVAVVGLERARERLSIAARYGCEAIVGDARDWALARDGLGCDGVLDAAGVSATMRVAMELARPGGWITKVGWGPQPLDCSLDPLVRKNLRLQGSFSHHFPVWERVLALLASGQLDIDPVLGGSWPLAEWHEAFERMHAGAIAKAVLIP